MLLEKENELGMLKYDISKGGRRVKETTQTLENSS